MDGGRLGATTRIAALLVLLAVACTAPTPAGSPAKPAAAPAAANQPAAKPAGQTVMLRGVSSWERTISFSQPFLDFIDRVQRKSGGELQIQFSGPEVVPPLEAVTAVSRGSFDLTWTTPSFYATNLSEGNALQFVQGPCQKYREAGALDLLDQVHRQKTNTTMLGCSGGFGYVFLTRDPVQSVAYFRGKKMRTVGLYTPILQALDASSVEVPPAEVYTALERRVIDGVPWPESGILERKLQEVLRYMVKPVWFETRLVWLMNVDSWNRLPPHLQRVLQEATREMEPEADTLFRKTADDEQVQLQAQGMQIITLTGAEADQMLKLINDASWGKVERESPDWGPRLREAFTRAAGS